MPEKVCCAVGCRNRQKKQSPVSFFRFPKDLSRRNLWTLSVARDGWSPSNGTVLCSDHFAPEAYVASDKLRTSLGLLAQVPRLRQDAIPTQFGDRPSPATTQSAQQTRRQIVDELKAAQNNAAGTQDKSSMSTRKTSCLDEADVESCSTPPPDLGPSAMASKLVQVALKPTSRSVRCQTTPKMAHAATQTTSFMATLVCASSQTDVVPQPRFWQSSPIHTPCSSPNHVPVENSDEEMSEEVATNEVDPSYVASMCDTTTGTAIECESLTPPTIERKFIVYEKKLLSLFKSCKICHKDILPQVRLCGTSVEIWTTCSDGHFTSWESQPMAGHKYAGNLLVAGGIEFCGLSPVKIVRLLTSIGVATFCERTFFRYQSDLLLPAVQEVWNEAQKEVLAAIDLPVTLAGDGRADSPGFSAKYGTYTLLDLKSNKILHVELVQSNEVGGSARMELEGLVRSIKHLEDRGVSIASLVTDRHSQIRKHLREKHPQIRHLFDCWHVAKGIKKKLLAVSQRKGFETIGLWISSIIRHLYYCAATSGGDGELVVAKWLSILNHISDVHLGHSELYPACEHGPLQRRKWIKQGTDAHDRLSTILASKPILKDIKQLSSEGQTYNVEAFHSTLTRFATKSVAYSNEVMAVRTFVAALHHNENAQRQQRETKDGRGQWKRKHPKARGGEPVVQPLMGEPTYGYINQLMETLLRLSVNPAAPRATAGSSGVPPPLSASCPQVPTDELVKRRRHRFSLP